MQDKLRTSLTVLLVGAFANSACAPTIPSRVVIPDDAAPSLRLPEDEHILNERLDLDVDPSSRTYRGVASIDLKLDRPRRALWLHGRDLRVTRATVSTAAHSWAAEWSSRPDGMATIRMPSVVPAGAATVRIEFEADFMSSDVGVSRVERDGRSYVFTQFAEIEARRAFPCFDEPGRKYPFTLAVTVPSSDDTVITNTDEESRVAAGNGRLTVRFQRTPPIPAYLVAFAIGPFDVVRAPDVAPSAIRPRPLQLRTIATRGMGGKAAFALSLATASIVALESYFDRPYPFGKLDLIAVPDKTGAMENPGAITFSEDILLADEAAASESDKADIIQDIAHEISHQWFGDSVTMSWWDDLWLNEAFATWLSAKISEQVDPGAGADLANLRATDRAMTIDARAAARSVRQPILSTDDIANALDPITYNKGSAVLGMFEHWTGADVFRRGIRAYVANHVYGSATATDLFSALSDAAGFDVARSFRSFIEQPGVPFVEAEVRCDHAPRVHLRQSRFAPLGSTIDPKARWAIPVCMRYGVQGAERQTCSMLADIEGDVSLEACPDWLTPNADAAGYYRVAIGHDALERTRRHLDRLSARETVSLASDLRAGMLRGSSDVVDVLETTASLVRDGRPEVVQEALTTFSLAHNWFFGDSSNRPFEAYARSLAKPTFDDLGWAPPASGLPESRARRRLRAMLFEFMARVGRDATVRREATARTLQFLGIGGDGKPHSDALPQDIVEIALQVAGEDGDERLFDEMLTRMERTDDAGLRWMLLNAIASFEQPRLAQRARELALSATLRGSEPQWLMVSQLASPINRADAWAWFLIHGDALIGRFHENTIRQWLLGAVGYMCESSRSDEVEGFLSREVPKIEGGPRTAAEARERFRLCAKQREVLLPKMRAFVAGRR